LIKFLWQRVVLKILVFGVIIENPSLTFNQIQIYPSFEHLWRYYLPSVMWPFADYLGRFFKTQLFWGAYIYPMKDLRDI